MASPPWLPSLNSHSNCDLYVVASQIKESRKEPLEPLISPSLVHLNITVSTTFFPDNPWNDRVLEGFSVVGTQALVSSTIDSPTECREKIRNILADMRVPLELGQTTWRHRFLNGNVYEMRGVEDVDRLIENVCWFLYEVKTQPHNKDFTVLPVNLAIMKRIVVPDDEFEAWPSWYNKMVDVDPDFEREYAKATGSLRTENELWHGFSFTFIAIEAFKHVRNEHSICYICSSENA